MKKFSILIIALLVISIMPIVMAVSVGSGVTPDIVSEDFPPQVWMCDNRIVLDDATEPGRVSLDGQELIERINNYAFEGEQIHWNVLVMDKNGIEKIKDVFVTIGDGQSNSNHDNTEIIVTKKTLTYCGNIPSTSTDWQKSISLPKYNPSLGNLTAVELKFETELISDIKIEHLSSSGQANFIATVDGEIILNYSDVFLQTNIIFDQNGTADAYDGVSDYAGPSGKTFPTISGSDTLTKNSSNLNDFIQTFPGENFNVSVEANSVFQVNGPGNYETSVLTNANAMACVTYTYEKREVVIIPGENNIEANCKINHDSTLFDSCNARILEEELTFNPNTMSFFDCTFTVETPESMYGEYWITAEATDLDDLSGTMDENEYWFFNPSIALSIDGDLTFEEVRSGTDAYSSTLLVGNDADDSSGVMMDMFISGTDFYDSSSSGAKCPTTNQLELENFRYFATNGDYNSAQDAGIDVPIARGDRNNDPEGYTNLGYGIGFNNPTSFYDGFEILQAQKIGPYYTANLLAPGAEMALTFKLSLPEPCNGDFDTGSIYFWGEAV